MFDTVLLYLIVLNVFSYIDVNFEYIIWWIFFRGKDDDE